MRGHRCSRVLVLLLGRVRRRPRGRTPSPRRQLPRGDEPVELDPADFTPGSDHPYFPLEPGTQWTYREIRRRTAPSSRGRRDGDQRDPADRERRRGQGGARHRDRGRVTSSRTPSTGTPRTRDGNVWYLGEETAEFEDGTRGHRARARSRPASTARCPASSCPRIRRPGWPTGRSTTRARPRTTAPSSRRGQQAEVPAGHFDDVAAHRRHDRARAGRPRVQALRPRRRAWSSRSTSPAGPAARSCCPRATVSDTAARAAGTAPLGTPYVAGDSHYIDPMIDRDRLATLRADEESRFVDLHPRSAACAKDAAGRCSPAYRCPG